MRFESPTPNVPETAPDGAGGASVHETDQKFEKVHEAFLSHFDTNKKDEEKLTRKKASSKRVTNAYLDSRRVGIEEDEGLTKGDKEEFQKLVDELESIRADLRKGDLSPEEAKEKRKRRGFLLNRLKTGAEAGITSEQVERARGRELVTEQRGDESLATERHDAVHEGETSVLAVIEQATDGFVEGTVMEKEMEEEAVHEVVNETLENVPEKERPSYLKKIVGAGFWVQEGKNKLLEKAFGLTHDLLYKKKEAPRNSNPGTFELLLRSYARSYQKAARKSHDEREAFYAGKEKVKAALNLASGGILGLRIMAGPAGMLSRVPAIFITSLSRFAESAKEVRFDKKMLSVSEEEATEEAWDLYEEAERAAAARGEVAPSFDDLSIAYGKGVMRGGIEAGNGVVTRLSVRSGYERLLAPLREKMDTIDNDGSLSESEKHERMAALMHANENLIKDLDRLVDTAGNVDAVGYGLRQTGVWSRRIAHLVALESLVELGMHGIGSVSDDGFVGHGTSEASRAAEDAMPEMSFIPPAEVASEPVTMTIEQGGSAWRAARDLAEKAGIDEMAFATAWADSTVELPDGREIPLSELHLVHAGDALAYVPGENGEAGLFTFENTSKLAHGDAMVLPGAVEMGAIHTEDFENTTWEEGADELPTEDVVAKNISTPEEVSDSGGGAEDASTEEGRASSMEQLTLEERVNREFTYDLRAVFGGEKLEDSEWQQWKGMTVKKFLSQRFDGRTPAGFLQRYVQHVMRDSNLRPLGGLFKKDEAMESYIRRALFIIVSKESRT